MLAFFLQTAVAGLKKHLDFAFLLELYQVKGCHGDITHFV